MILSVPISDIIIHVFSWLPESFDSRMYLLRCTENEEIICVDPCFCKEALSLLASWRPHKIIILLTHEHFDHSNGLNILKLRYNCQVICTKACAEAIKDSKKNLSAYALMLQSVITDLPLLQEHIDLTPFTCEADIVFKEKYLILWGSHTIKLFEMPGHSKGSLCAMLDDIIIFTGDNLIPGRKVVTCLPGGNKTKYNNIVKPFLNDLGKNVLVLPGHFDAVPLIEC